MISKHILSTLQAPGCFSGEEDWRTRSADETRPGRQNTRPRLYHREIPPIASCPRQRTAKTARMAPASLPAGEKPDCWYLVDKLSTADAFDPGELFYDNIFPPFRKSKIAIFMKKVVSPW